VFRGIFVNKTSLVKPKPTDYNAIKNRLQGSRSKYVSEFLQDIPTKYVSKFLQEILILISFQWKPEKLISLEEIIEQVLRYETNVSVVIVTDEPSAMASVANTWGLSKLIRTWDASHLSDSHMGALLWEHRNAIAQILKHESFTSVVVLEDDIRLSWPSLQSWALDTELLLPYNFRRCFFRTEFGTKGDIRMLDWTQALEIVSEVNLIDFKAQNQEHYEEISKRTAGQLCGYLRNGTSFKCELHQYFVSPCFHYHGMWAATKSQLTVLMSHPFWYKQVGLGASLPELCNDSYGGYMERANSIFNGVNVPDGFSNNCMVPVLALDPSRTSWVLSGLGAVEHMTNKYADHDIFSKVTFSNALTYKH